jgi:hypothetical protein
VKRCIVSLFQPLIATSLVAAQPPLAAHRKCSMTG